MAVVRCWPGGAERYRSHPDSFGRTLALTAGAMLFFAIANAFPIVGLKLQGQVIRTTHFHTIRKTEMKMLKILLLVIAAALAAPVIAQDKGAAKAAPADKGAMNMEILRDKIRADKKLIVAHNMTLTDAEAKAFWPVYDAYQKELQQINERLVKMISAYADAYNKGPMSNETAKKLLGEALAIEEAELKLKRSYVPRLEKALPETKVARYIQIENKIRAVVKYGIADNIPLVE